MKNKMGFILIEWMIHFLLLNILLLVVAALLMSWYTNVTDQGRLCDNALSIHLAADALRSDVHNAHNIICDQKGLRISYNHTVFVWLYEGSALWRQKTVFAQGSWNKPFKSLFAQHIAKNAFVVKPLSSVSASTYYVIWQVNEKVFIFGTRNGLVI